MEGEGKKCASVERRIISFFMVKTSKAMLTNSIFLDENVLSVARSDYIELCNF